MQSPVKVGFTPADSESKSTVFHNLLKSLKFLNL
jgi:hypothetical protein